ncbi:MAG: HAMP domain-containing protein [Acidobacteria bacterium]|nr:HAMP domain-containing protein [Acidobacteriota bacterium]
MPVIATPMMVLAVLVAIVCLAVLFAAVRRRWFSRIQNGFLATLVTGLVCAGVIAALLVGVWGYEEARQILHQQIVADLENVGRIVEQQAERDVAGALALMSDLAQDLAPAIGSRNRAQIEEEMREVEKIDPRFLQLRLTDSQARIVAERSVTGVLEPISRVGVAFSLEGKAFATDPYLSTTFNKYVLNLSVPIRSAAGDVDGALTSRYDIQGRLVELTRSARFNLSGYAVIVGSDGHILAHPEAARVNDDISSYPAVQLALQGRSGTLQAANKAGQEKIMFYRPIKSPATVNPKPLALLSEISASEVEQALRMLRYKFLLVILLAAAGSALIALPLGRSIKQPVLELVRLTEGVGQGDLTLRAAATGQDEMGRLAGSFNQMVAGLEERERVKQVFGQYVATQVSEKVLKGEVNLGGESRVVTILFSDIRSFTAMSEEMTPNQVVSFLNDYFSEMVEAVFEQGGLLDKFIGDGMMAVFGAFGDTPDHARQAVRAGLRMKARLSKINGERSIAGKPPISIGIGIHTDEVILGNIGTSKRLQYTAIGDGVNTCSRVQSLNKEFGTTILITETTYHLVKDEFECRHMPEAHIRGKTKTLEFYEVTSAKAVDS